MAKYRFAAAVCAVLSLSFGPVALAQSVLPDDDRPPLLSAPPPPGEAPTGDAATARRTPGAGIDPAASTDFFTDYPPEVVPPKATRHPVTTESSSAIK